MPKDGKICMSCGGEVGEDGFSTVLGEDEEFSNFEDDETEQHKSTVEMRDDSGFARAVQRMAEGGYAGIGPQEIQNKGGKMVTEDMDDEQREASKRPNFNFETPEERQRYRDDYEKKRAEAYMAKTRRLPGGMIGGSR